MLEYLAERKQEINERKKEITQEIEAKIENADKREFNNRHINREVTFNIYDELFERFSKEYESELEKLEQERKDIITQVWKVLKYNPHQIREKYSDIDRIDDILRDIQEGTEYQRNAVSYFLDKINS